ncbi:hypothetical protein SAY86_026334 [Trapa natans]|uniref:SET domain-containing protein n=1 Tax=Trapa natans TaxID=22666 RepID=A0AAN7QEN5_TRANT|nr:hypothetical protein SAY86_026334 [Trapa natans]
MLPLARRVAFLSRLRQTINQSGALLRLSYPISIAASGSRSLEAVDNAGRPGPPPIQVGLTASAGRGIFASRRITSGDLIHTASPVVCYPSLATVHSVCYFCLRRLSNAGAELRASQTVSYCSDKCKDLSKAFRQVESSADWSAHDEYCRLQGLKYPLLVKRFACMVLAGEVAANYLDILQPAPLSSGMISEMEKGYHLLRNGFKEADIRSEQMSFLTKQWYVGLLARIRINAFRIELAGGLYEDLLSLATASVESEAAVGNAVYMLPSFYNHDCDPNAHIIWLEDASARTKALRDIEPGEELKICYIDASLGCDVRQALLSQGFGFHCNCDRCLSGD